MAKNKEKENMKDMENQFQEDQNLSTGVLGEECISISGQKISRARGNFRS